jgi:hypothetical protein
MKDNEEQSVSRKIAVTALSAIFAALLVLFLAPVVAALWNYAAVPVFGLPMLAWRQALCLLVLVRLVKA